MKRIYLEVRIREGDMQVAPDKHIVECLDVRETRVFVAIIAGRSDALAQGAFDAAVQAIKEVTGQ